MFPGGVHQGKARQKGLQVEAHVSLGSGFAPAVPSPIQAPGLERDGGGVHHVDQSFESKGELRTPSLSEARVELLEMIENLPEQGFGHHGITHPVGVGEGVLAGRGGPANRQYGAGVQS